MKTELENLTYTCDYSPVGGGSCDHETDCLHRRGAGVYCAECAARRVSLSCDPAAEEAEQEATLGEQRVKYAHLAEAYEEEIAGA